jgi:ABC-type glycerol-3-phosphate transport system permease component
MKEALGRNRLTSHKGWLTALMVIFFVYIATLVFPCVWLFLNSLKTDVEFFKDTWALPKEPLKNLANYLTAFDMSVTTKLYFRDVGLPLMFLNTIYLSFIPPLFSLFFTCCTAYAYARHQFKLKGLLYTMLVIPMVVNIAGTLPTVYKLIQDIGIYNNIFLIMVTGWSGAGFNFLLISSVFENISGTYKEAAQIDGAGHWRIFLTIYIPQASNLLVSMYVLAVIGAWNDYMTPYLYLPEFPTLATGIYELRSKVEKSRDPLYYDQWPRMFAVMIWSILPVLVLFIAFQDRIMTMTSGGGIKE